MAPWAGAEAPAAAQGGRNDGILRLGDLTPEKLPVLEIGGRVLSGWVCQPGRYPITVAALLDDARNRYRERLRPDDGLLQTVFEAARAYLGRRDAAPAPGAEDTLLDQLHDAEQRLRRAVEAAASDRPAATTLDWEEYVTTCLTAVVEGLEVWQAELMTAEQRLGVLVRCRVFDAPDAAAAPEAAATAPPDPAGSPSTGDGPAPASPSTST